MKTVKDKQFKKFQSKLHLKLNESFQNKILFCKKKVYYFTSFKLNYETYRIINIPETSNFSDFLTFSNPNLENCAMYMSSSKKLF